MYYCNSPLFMFLLSFIFQIWNELLETNYFISKIIYLVTKNKIITKYIFQRKFLWRKFVTFVVKWIKKWWLIIWRCKNSLEDEIIVFKGFFIHWEANFFFFCLQMLAHSLGNITILSWKRKWLNIIIDPPFGPLSTCDTRCFPLLFS